MNERKARKHLAANMRVQRLMRGWSQEALAHACGLHRSYVGSLERAGRNVSLDNLEKIAGAFGISVSDLLREPDPRTLGEQMLTTIHKALNKGGGT